MYISVKASIICLNLEFHIFGIWYFSNLALFELGTFGMTLLEFGSSSKVALPYMEQPPHHHHVTSHAGFIIIPSNDLPVTKWEYNIDIVIYLLDTLCPDLKHVILLMDHPSKIIVPLSQTALNFRHCHISSFLFVHVRVKFQMAVLMWEGPLL